MAATKAALAHRAARLAEEEASRFRARREELAKRALDLFDEISESETCYASPESIDVLTREIVLRRVGMESKSLARGTIYYAIMHATEEEDVIAAIQALRRDRDSMLECKAEEHAAAMAEWLKARPAPLSQRVRRGAKRYLAGVSRNAAATACSSTSPLR
jgi:hypothetical protein